MALARVKTWVKETLTFQDLNAEFNNILNNATALISPMTGTLDLDGNSLVLDSDGDTVILNSTGNTVQFQVGGAVSYIMTTTAFDLTGKQLVFDDDNDTYLSAAVDDTLVFTIGGATTYTASATIFDFNALRLDLDADNDTSLRASTDDTIIIEVGGSDIYTITATAFDFNGQELILDADADSSLTVDTDDVAHLRLQGFDAFIFDGDVASPVNGLTFTSTATGVDPIISSHGEANAGITITPSGSGGITASAAITASEGIVIPTTKDITLTDAPSAGTDAANKTYVDTKQALLKTAVLADQRASGTDGGTATSGSWETRTLQTTVTDVDLITSISTNQFTLQAGTYRVEFSATAFSCNGHQSRIYNATDAAVAIYGNTGSSTTGDSSQSTGAGIVTIAGAKAFEVQTRVETTRATDGYGSNNSFGNVEQYVTVTITQLA